MVTCNADGTMNANRLITHMAKVILNLGLGHQETITCLLGKCKSHKLMLRDDWLWKHNPTIDWNNHRIKQESGPDIFAELMVVNHKQGTECGFVKCGSSE